MPLGPTDGAVNVPGSGPVASDAEPRCGSPRIDAAGHGKRPTRIRSRHRRAGDHDTEQVSVGQPVRVSDPSLTITRTRAHNSRPVTHPTANGRGAVAAAVLIVLTGTNTRSCKRQHTGRARVLVEATLSAGQRIPVTDKRVAQWLTPRVALRVERAEVGPEVPVAPAQAQPLGLEPYEPCPLLPGCQAGLLVTAELADEQRAVVVAGPGRRPGEVVTDRAPVSVISPRGAQPLISPGPPRRALVGELQRRVVVNTDDQAVIVWQFKLRQCAARSTAGQASRRSAPRSASTSRESGAAALGARHSARHNGER
jgi:hypothetical protein